MHRPGAQERVALVLRDWLETHRRLADTETRMTAVLDELLLRFRVSSTPLQLHDRQRFVSAQPVVDPARRRLRRLPMTFLPRGGLPLRRQEDMMAKVETSTLEGCFAADPGRGAGPRSGSAGHRSAGAPGDGTIRPMIRTGERGAL